MTLRPYQSAAIEQARASIRRGNRRLVLVSPTGSGKTHIFAEMIRLTRGRALFLGHTEEIIEQTSEKLVRAGVHHGIIKAGYPESPSTVQVASVQTLFRRLEARPAADVVFLDECHHVGARTFRAVVDAYPDAVIVGATATPYRLDGQGLGGRGGVFQDLIVVTTVAELVAAEHLVPTVVWGAAQIDLSRVRTVAGDFARGALGTVMTGLVGDAAAHYARLGEGRTAVCFAATVPHSLALVEAFGPISRHIDAKTKNRGRLLAGLGVDYNILVNVGIATEGWDLPRVSCVILCRPTMSRGLHRQMIGRGMRPWGEKRDCLVLDHAGNTGRHGFAEDPEVFTLVGREKREREPVAPVTQCGECFRVYPSILGACPSCGTPRPAKTRRIRQTGGELTRVDRNRLMMGPDRQHAMLVRWTRERDERRYKTGYPAARFKEVFGRWPTGQELRAASDEVRPPSSTSASSLFRGLTGS